MRLPALGQCLTKRQNVGVRRDEYHDSELGRGAGDIGFTITGFAIVIRAK
jgi:hypothetical protein